MESFLKKEGLSAHNSELFVKSKDCTDGVSVCYVSKWIVYAEMIASGTSSLSLLFNAVPDIKKEEYPFLHRLKKAFALSDDIAHGISDFEGNHGESFVDYFMDANVEPSDFIDFVNAIGANMDENGNAVYVLDEECNIASFHPANNEYDDAYHHFALYIGFDTKAYSAFNAFKKKYAE